MYGHMMRIGRERSGLIGVRRVGRSRKRLINNVIGILGCDWSNYGDFVRQIYMKAFWDVARA